MVKLIGTGIFVKDKDMIRLQTCKFDPTATMYGPKKTKEPWEVLQEIAGEYGLPKLKDMYGMSNNSEIMFRGITGNKKKLESILKKINNQ